MRGFLLACLVLLCGSPALAQQRLETAVHASGAERLAMLAERIARTHLQMAQGVLVGRSRRSLRESVREFDALLPRVASLAPDAEARESFLLLGLLWKELRAWAQKAPTRENARNVSERAEEVSWIASKGARLIGPQDAGQSSALAAMQAATLAERVARLHLVERMGAADARRRSDLAGARTRLAAALASLARAPQGPGPESELQMAGTQHEFLRRAMDEYDSGRGSAAIEVIAKAAGNLADALERAARLYEERAN